MQCPNTAMCLRKRLPFWRARLRPGRVRGLSAHDTRSAFVKHRKVAVARRRNGSDGVSLGTVATARDGYQRQGSFFSENRSGIDHARPKLNQGRSILVTPVLPTNTRS